MTVSADQVVIAPGGTVSVAPEGTTEPANETTTLNAAFVDLGYVSEDGVTFRSAPNVTDIGAWQSEYPIRSLTQGREGSLAFVLRQWNRDTFATAFGGGTFTSPGAGHMKYAPPSGAQAVNVVVVDWADGANLYRIVVPRAQIVEAVETPLRRAAAADLPVTFRILGPEGAGDPWYLLTNDSAFS